MHASTVWGDIHTDSHADLVVRWKGGAISELSVPVKRKPPNTLRTDEDTIDLIRRLAAHYPDATIAHILNRQDRRTARGLSYTAGRVQSLRHHYNIPCHQHRDDPAGEPLTVTDAAKELGLAPRRRLHRRRTTHPRRRLPALIHPRLTASTFPGRPAR